ncbi:MAG: aromatic ring-hydroxylating dioxygenase subunit alpha [Chitinophagales bacterium]|nr:aromatic ring-hydroxylating dioxygenase subunit alpha [Chitinophagales bacterium]MDW8273985.1 aromatic ring-hydroxylating dioxygenase subunit alpha [Chitinophagales bacterium]
MYFTNQWYLICLTDELKNQNPLEKKILGQELVVFRTEEGNIHVIENRCCHRNVKLSLGYVKGGCIKCAYHGWEFNGAGKCVSIPSLEDDQMIPETARIKSYPVKIYNHMVWVFIGNPALADEKNLPPMEEMRDLPYVFNYHWLKADLKLVAESLIDPYHIDHVHRNSIKTFMGNLSRKQVNFVISADNSCMTGEYYRENRGSFFEKLYFGFEPEIKTNFGFWFPHTSKLQINFTSKKRTLYIYEHFYPVEGDTICMLQITIWDNIFKGFDAFAKWFMLRKSNKIVEEDIVFLESNKYFQDNYQVRDLLIKSDKVTIEFSKLWRTNISQYSNEEMVEAEDCEKATALQSRIK